MAVVSTDHADEKLCAEDLLDREDEMRSISVDDVEKHNGKDKKSFWAVVDGMRVFVLTLRYDKTQSHTNRLGCGRIGVSDKSSRWIEKVTLDR